MNPLERPMPLSQILILAMIGAGFAAFILTLGGVSTWQRLHDRKRT